MTKPFKSTLQFSLFLCWLFQVCPTFSWTNPNPPIFLRRQGNDRTCFKYRAKETTSTMPPRRGMRLTSQQLAASADDIEYQSDNTKYGRGEMHLSATLDTGDIVVYQTGTWLVDGVEVGDGGPPQFHYGVVETIQLVWTHNCEHGVIRALPLGLSQENDNQGEQILVLQDEECSEFGPEQLVAKLPLEWNEDAGKVESPMLLSDDLWQ